jgi:hypothetical protein
MCACACVRARLAETCLDEVDDLAGASEAGEARERHALGGERRQLQVLGLGRKLRAAMST